MTELNRSLNRSDVDVQQISEGHGKIAEELKSLNQEAYKQQESVNNTQQQVLRIKHSDPIGRNKSSVSLYYLHICLSSLAYESQLHPMCVGFACSVSGVLIMYFSFLHKPKTFCRLNFV